MSHAATMNNTTPRQPSALALATGSLSVPAGELEDLYDYFVREMHEHEQIAAACTRDHQKLERFKRTGKAAACYDASVRVRLLLDRAKERQPTENVKDEPRAERVGSGDLLGVRKLP